MSETRATLHPSTRVGACTDKQSSRYALANVLILPETDSGCVWCCECNSYVLAAYRQTGETDQPRMMPASVVPTSGKRRKIVLNGRWENQKQQFAPEVTEGRFPRVPEVLPAIDPMSLCVTLDPALLLNLARSLNSESKGVTLFIPPAGTKGQVDAAIPVVGDTGIGIIMPLAKRRSDAEGQYASDREAFIRDYNESKAYAVNQVE